MPHEVETMMYSVAEGLPWHGLGTPVPEAVDSEEALVRAGLAWAVEQLAIYVPQKRRDVEMPVEPMPEGVSYMVHVDGWVANVRATDGRVLGVVSDKYRVVQNVEAFRFADQLLGEGVRYTTAGSLRGGQRIFLCAVLPDDVQLLGDRIAPYLVLTNSHDGSHGVRVCITPVRVVCMNTLNIALANAKRSWSTVHVGDLQGRVREAAETLGLARKYLWTLKREAAELAEKRISLEEYVAKLLPVPDDATERMKKTIEDRRADILTLAQVENLKPFAGTAWQFLNAVADYADHAPPSRKTLTFAERRAEQVIDGHPLLDAAYRLVSAN